MSLPRNPKQATIDLDIAISKLSAEEKLKRCQRRAYWIGQALGNNKPQKDMYTREQKKPFVIWLMVIMFINFVLLACAWVKTVQHQNDAAINYIMVFLVVNIIGARVHKRMVRKLTNQ